MFSDTISLDFQAALTQSVDHTGYAKAIIAALITPDHRFTIQNQKNGMGFVATCQCGTRLLRSQGCNRAGYWYAYCNAVAVFQEHMRIVGVQPPATGPEGNTP